MNVYNCDTLDDNLINGFIRANTQCLNSNLKRNKPYDQVLYNLEHTNVKDYQVIDMFDIFGISKLMKNKKVIAKYSDYHPIFFTII